MKKELTKLLEDLRETCARWADDRVGRYRDDETGARIASNIRQIELDATVDKFIAVLAEPKPEVMPSNAAIAFGVGKYPPSLRRLNLLKSCANWLSTRAKTFVAKDCGWDSIMQEYATELLNIRHDLNTGVLLARSEYEALLEYKAMYEGLCK